MKHIEDVPWMICDEGDVNYCAYVDTDSNYFHAEPILKHFYPDFDEMSDEDKDKKLEKVALKYQYIITDSYNTLAKECFNVPTHRLEMKTECVIRSAYFRKTRRYAQWITMQEGIPLIDYTPKKPKDNGVVGVDNGGQGTGEKLKEGVVDIKGLEFKKANFPPVLGKFFKDILIDVLKGSTQTDVDQKVKEFKNQILSGDIPLTKLGNPTGVKTLNKYMGRKPKAGEMFTQMLKGAPVSAKAAAVYNDLIRFWKLNQKHSYIAQGDKIKYIYLKPNPYQIDTLGFLDFDLPEKIVEFMEKYADRQKIFDSILLNKLEGFYDDLGWSLNLNPYKDKFFSFS